MRREDDLVRTRHPVQQHGDQLGAFERVGVADGVGDVDRARPGLDGDFNHAAQVVMLGSGGIHRRPLHIVAQVAGMGHGVVDPLCHLVHVQIGNGAVQRRGADEGVNARRSGVLDRLPAAVDVLVIGAGEAADRGVLRTAADVADSREIPLAGDGKARLDDIDAHFIQKAGNLQLFVMGHGRAGRLLAIAQGGVEDHDFGLGGFGGGRGCGTGLCLFGHNMGPRRVLSAFTWALVTSERSRLGGTLRGG